MIICYTVLEISYLTHVIVVFHFGQLFVILQPNSPKIKKNNKIQNKKQKKQKP